MSNYEMSISELENARRQLTQVGGALQSSAAHLNVEKFKLSYEQGAGVRQMERHINACVKQTQNQIDNINQLKATLSKVMNETATAETKARLEANNIKIGNAKTAAYVSPFSEWNKFRGEISDINTLLVKPFLKIIEDLYGTAAKAAPGIHLTAKEIFGFNFDDKSLYGKASNVGKFLGYLGIALGTIGHVQENMHNGATGTKTLADASTDVLSGLAKMAAATGAAKIGAAIGTAIGGPAGTVVGALAGAAFGFIAGRAYDALIKDAKFDGHSIYEYFSRGLEVIYSGVSSAISSGAKMIGDAVAGWAKNTIFAFG